MAAAARDAGEGDSSGRASDLREDLLGQHARPGQPGDGVGDGEAADGETDDQITMDSAGSKSSGKGGRPLTPEQIRKLLEAGAQLKPSQGPGHAEGEGMYLTQLFGKDSQELEQMREQLGEIGTMPGAGRLILGRNRSQDSYYAYDEWDYVASDYRRNWCRLREILLDGDNGDFFTQTLAALFGTAAAGPPTLPEYPPGVVSHGARARGRRRNRRRSHHRGARRAPHGRDS